jgi:hypothetical protein
LLIGSLASHRWLLIKTEQPRPAFHDAQCCMDSLQVARACLLPHGRLQVVQPGRLQGAQLLRLGPHLSGKLGKPSLHILARRCPANTKLIGDAAIRGACLPELERLDL